jgi:DNA polymerase-3 subunit epsilon
MREIVFDTETTGLDASGEDRIIEIAAIEILNNVCTDNYYHVYIDPERDIPDSAFRVHGISREFLSDKPKFADIIDGFLNFIGDDPLIAHNAEFDMKFLNAELQRLGRSPIEKNPVIDTLVLARRKHPGTSVSLDALCTRYGIDKSRRTKHGALVDSQILAEVYLELKIGRQSSLSFTVHREIRKVQRHGLTKFRPTTLSAQLDESEIDDHSVFVAALSGRALWSKYAPDPEP